MASLETGGGDGEAYYISVDDRLREWTEELRFIPGGRYDRRGIWKFPRTPSIAHALYKVFKADTPYDIQYLAKQRSPETTPSWKYSSAPLPARTVMKPWKHQRQAFRFAKRTPAVMLALGMGAGKTKIFADLLLNTREMQRVLVVAPLRAIEDVWIDQFAKHIPEGYPLHVIGLDEGANSARTAQAHEAVVKAMENSQKIVVVINFETVWREPFAAWALTAGWDCVTIDESHRIMSAGGKVSHYMHMLGRRVERRVCMTGTPMPNTPLDAYAQYRFLDEGIFGSSKERFLDRYAIMGGFGGYQVLGYKNKEEFNRKFHSIAFVVGDEVLDLPPIHKLWRTVAKDEKTRKIYDKLDKELTVEIGEDSITVDNALVKMTRLHQLASGYAITDDKKGRVQVNTGKRELFAEVLGDLKPREPVVVFYRFKEDLNNIVDVCKGLKRTVGQLNGSMNDLKSWKESKYDVLAVQIQSGKESIDLTRARYAIFYSMTFSMGDYDQCWKRVHRPGQTKKTVIIHLGMKGTIDILIWAAIREKRVVVDYCLKEYRRRAAARQRLSA